MYIGMTKPEGTDINPLDAQQNVKHSRFLSIPGSAGVFPIPSVMTSVCV